MYLYVYLCASIYVPVYLNRCICILDSFVLNTTVTAPHDAQITDMRFCPVTADSHITVLVTTSEDGHFKAWQLVPPAKDQGKLSHSAATTVLCSY